jgi:hypothetical protein
MEMIRNILPTIQIGLAIICWGFAIYYIIERIKEIKKK